MSEEEQEPTEEEQAEAPPEEREPVAAGQYVAPVLMRSAFHCLHCGVYAMQFWSSLSVSVSGGRNLSTPIRKASCFNCQKESFWLAGANFVSTGEDPDAPLLWPLRSASAPPPHPDMPSDPKADYEEALAIVERSPRGAAALSRLAVQKLCVALGEPGKNINDDIQSLVKRGLAPEVQQALDVLRVIGNNAVHPGQIDLKDDRDTALTLFGLLNFIVEQQITRPKEIGAIYKSLPANALTAIQKRDSSP